jgi:dephospho-CoA kinase
MLILGITGGIATGKSTVTQMLADLGAPVVSADAISRELLAAGTATTSKVAAAFPDAVAVPDPLTIDRRRLSKIVFADDAARATLEAIMHPSIIARLSDDISRLREVAEPGAAAIEIPLLFEAGLLSMVDRVVVVACDDQRQIDRLKTRLAIDEAEARAHIASQMPLKDKIAQADNVISTDMSIDDTRLQVDKLWQSIQ